MKADHTRWCSGTEFPISLKVERILNDEDDRFIIKKVNLHLSRFLSNLKALKSVDEKYRRFYLDSLMVHTKQVIIDYDYYNEPLKTHLLNLITALYRKNT